MGFPPNQPNWWRVRVSLEIEDVRVKRAKNERETTLLSFIRKIILKERCVRTDDSYLRDC